MHEIFDQSLTALCKIAIFRALKPGNLHCAEVFDPKLKNASEAENQMPYLENGSEIWGLLKLAQYFGCYSISSQAISGQTINGAGRTKIANLEVLIAKKKLPISDYIAVTYIATTLRRVSVTISDKPDTCAWAPRNKRLHHLIFHDAGIIADEAIKKSLALPSNNFLHPQVEHRRELYA